MWFSDLRTKRQEEKMRFLNGKETQVMHLLWTEEKDLSVYGIQRAMHKDYSEVYDSATIENQLFSLEKKGFVNIYFQDYLPWAHSVVTQDEYKERFRQQERERYERYEKSLLGRLGRKRREWTEEDQKELESILASFHDEEDD